MKRNAVLRNYHGFAIPQKIIFGRHVVTMETGNPNFTEPSPTPAEKTIATDALDAAAQEAINGDSDKIRIMHEREAEWEKIMDDNADYVEDIAKGDIDILLSSGHAVTKVNYDKKAKPEQLVGHTKPAGNGALTAYASNTTNAEGILTFLSFAEEVEGIRIEATADRQINIYVGDKLAVSILALTKHRGVYAGLPRHKMVEFSMIGFNAAGLSPISEKLSDISVP